MSKTREAFERASQRRIESREIDGIGTVRLRNITARELIPISESLDSDEPAALNRAFVLLAVGMIVDEDDEPVFTMADKDLLLGLDAKPGQQLFMACLEVCGLTDTAKNLAEVDASLTA